MEVWDLLDRCHEPAITCTISMAMVTSLCFSPPDEEPDNTAKPASHKQYLAVGGFSGFGLLGIDVLMQHLKGNLFSCVDSAAALLTWRGSLCFVARYQS